MRPEDFFAESVTDGFGGPSRVEVFMSDFATQIRASPVAGHDDLEVAVALGELVHEELEKFGTEGGPRLSDQEMRHALLALRALVDRLGVTGVKIPFRDFQTFRSYWIRRGASGAGGWQARRDLLDELFDPLHEQLAAQETRALTSHLVEPASPHSQTGWTGVDGEIQELRRHFRSARTPQDYRGVGNDCAFVIEALSRQVYSPAVHLRPGEQEPPPSNTKLRLERFIEDAIPGPENAALRKLARSVIEVAQQVKHSETPTRREAGIAADAVIQLANLLRRLSEPA